MTHRAAILSVIGLMVMMGLPHAVAAGSDGSPVSGMTQVETGGKVEPVPTKNEAALPAQTIPPGSGSSLPIAQEAPTISGRYSIGGTMVMPFLGASFGGGYMSDVDRSVNNRLSAPAESGLRSLFGQSFVPNEFRLGIRIPF